MSSCDHISPRLPKKGTDEQIVCDRYGNQWQYDAETKSWIPKGFTSVQQIVTEDNDGIITPEIFERLAQLRAYSADNDLTPFKLLPGIDAYWYYFKSSDRLIKFDPEGNDSLRIEVDKGRLFQILQKERCMGVRGPTGLTGDTGRAGKPGPEELCFSPHIEGNRLDFAIFTPTPLLVDGSPIQLPGGNVPNISVRLFRTEPGHVELSEQLAALTVYFKQLSSGHSVWQQFEKTKQILLERSLGATSTDFACDMRLSDVLISDQGVAMFPEVTIEINPLDPTEITLEYTNLPVDEQSTLDSIEFNPQTGIVCGSIYSDEQEWGQEWCVKSRQKGPDGPRGEPGECKIKIVECVIDDTNILAVCPIINVRPDCESGVIYTLCSDIIETFCADQIQLLPNAADLSNVGALESIFAAAQITLDECKSVHQYQVELPEETFAEPDLIHWDPQPGCFTRRHYDRFKFNWIPMTAGDACDPEIRWFSPDAARPLQYPHELVMAPEPSESSCKDDFFYCPALEEPPCPVSPSISASRLANDIHSSTEKINNKVTSFNQGMRRWNINHLSQ